MLFEENDNTFYCKLPRLTTWETRTSYAKESYWHIKSARNNRTGQNVANTKRRITRDENCIFTQGGSS